MMKIFVVKQALLAVAWAVGLGSFAATTGCIQTEADRREEEEMRELKEYVDKVTRCPLCGDILHPGARCKE